MLSAQKGAVVSRKDSGCFWTAGKLLVWSRAGELRCPDPSVCLDHCSEKQSGQQ